MGVVWLRSVRTYGFRSSIQGYSTIKDPEISDPETLHAPGKNIAFPERVKVGARNIYRVDRPVSSRDVWHDCDSREY